jgi:hypothetical protein
MVMAHLRLMQMLELSKRSALPLQIIQSLFQPPVIMSQHC